MTDSARRGLLLSADVVAGAPILGYRKVLRSELAIDSEPDVGGTSRIAFTPLAEYRVRQPWIEERAESCLIDLVVLDLEDVLPDIVDGVRFSTRPALSARDAVVALVGAEVTDGIEDAAAVVATGKVSTWWCGTAVSLSGQTRRCSGSSASLPRASHPRQPIGSPQHHRTSSRM